MSEDLPDESSRLYRYVRQLDRRVTTLRHKASSRQPVLSVTWFVLICLLLIPAVAVVIFLIQRTHTQYVLLTGPPGSTTARLAPPAPVHSQQARAHRATAPSERHTGF